MGQRECLSQADREYIYQVKLKGQRLPELARAVGCSQTCARKWWRIGRDRGVQGLRAKRRGRGKKGCLSQLDYQTLTSRDPQPVKIVTPIQLSLPFLA